MALKMYGEGYNPCLHVVKPQLFNFVLVSAINMPPHWTISTLEQYIEGKDLSIKEDVDLHLRTLEPDSFCPTPGDWKDLHVMLIEENEDGDAARRLGVANLRLDDWLRSGPVMEDIVLE
ncbi:hypothetical protein B7463_g887, partial [Scytalidium lignicola]